MFYNRIIKYVKHNRLKAQYFIYKFIKDVNNKTELLYTSKTKLYLERDFKRIRQQLLKQYSPVFQKYGLRMSYTIQVFIFKIEKNNQSPHLHVTETIDVK